MTMNAHSTPGTKRPLVLSFEAGGDPRVAAQMLDILRQEGTKASIFILGMWATEHPDLVRRMADEGHELGNHSYSHPDLTQLDDDQIRAELDSTGAVVKQITGQPATHWLRPPYGAVDERLRRVAADGGYRLVLRDAVDGGHWPGETTTGSIVQRSLDNAYDGAVITYHLNSPLTVQVLGDIIRQLRAQNYDFVGYSDLPQVSEHAERHPNSHDIEIEPSFLQVMRAKTRAWSMDVRDYGTRGNTPTGQPIRLTETDRYGVTLISGVEGEDPLNLPPSEMDRHLLAMHGGAECLFRGPDDDDVRLRVLARPGYLTLWPQGYELSIEAASPQWLLLILE